MTSDIYIFPDGETQWDTIPSTASSADPFPSAAFSFSIFTKSKTIHNWCMGKMRIVVSKHIGTQSFSMGSSGTISSFKVSFPVRQSIAAKIRSFTKQCEVGHFITGSMVYRHDTHCNVLYQPAYSNTGKPWFTKQNNCYAVVSSPWVYFSRNAQVENYPTSTQHLTYFCHTYSFVSKDFLRKSYQKSCISTDVINHSLGPKGCFESGYITSPFSNIAYLDKGGCRFITYALKNIATVDCRSMPEGHDTLQDTFGTKYFVSISCKSTPEMVASKPGWMCRSIVSSDLQITGGTKILTNYSFSSNSSVSRVCNLLIDATVPLLKYGRFNSSIYMGVTPESGRISS